MRLSTSSALHSDPEHKARSGRLESRRNFFSVRVIKEWNRIPAAIKRKTNAASFKAAYAKYREETALPPVKVAENVSRNGRERGVPWPDVLHSGSTWISEDD